MRKIVTWAVVVFALVVLGVLAVGIWMGWGHDQARALGAVLSGLGSLLAATSILGAGWYFLFRKYRGYQVPNLSVGITCERRPSEDPDCDWLSIFISLKKGDRALLSLLSPLARLICLEEAREVTFKEIELWGCNLVRTEKTANGLRIVDWDPKDGRVESLNLPPGEETQLATAVRVHANEAYRVDVVIRAAQIGDKRSGKEKIGQWHASTVSVPLPNESLQPTRAASPVSPKQPASAAMRYRHQLNIHLDYGPQCFQVGGLEVRYGYHYGTEHQLRERVMRIPPERLEPELVADLDKIYKALSGRIPEPAAVRLPHAEICPTIRPTGLTLVVLDQARAAHLPIARLYYIEEIPELDSSIERQVYLEQPHWTPEEREICDRVRQRVRKLAWEDYSRLVGHNLLGSVEEGV